MTKLKDLTPWSRLTFKLSLLYPAFKVIPKEDSRLMRFLAILLKPISPQFLTRYTTTVGYRVYMPRYLINTQRGYRILRHEHVHIRQYHYMGWLFWVCYLFCFPTVFTMRAYFEIEAYRESLRQWMEENRSKTPPPRMVDDIVSEFTGPRYFWMCPFPEYVREKLLDKLV